MLAPDRPSRSFPDGISVGVLTRLCHRDLVDRVLEETGRREQRSRLLPARVVVYYVLALGLFSDDSYEDVMRRLVNGLTFLGAWRDDWRVPSSSAISQARKRLGDAPMRALFARIAHPAARRGARGLWFRGWRVMTVETMAFDVADTPENVASFVDDRRPGSGDGSLRVRMVGLKESGTHAIVAAAIDGCAALERDLLARLVADLDADMLVLADHCFFEDGMWSAARETGADLLWRVGDDVELPVMGALPDGSFWSELFPRAGDRPAVPIRVIEYEPHAAGRHGVVRLATSITDHLQASASELATLYQQRQEFEFAVDRRDPRRPPRSKALRSKSPDLVRQEIWALLIAHYAVRHYVREAVDVQQELDVLARTRTVRIV